MYIIQIERTLNMTTPIAIFQRNYRAGTHIFYTLGDGSSNDPLSTFVNQNPIETIAVIKGNVGIGTTDTSQGKLVVAGNIVPSACNVYDLGTSDLRWKDLYLSGNTIDLGGTRITQDTDSGGIRILNTSGVDVDIKGANIYATTGIGIGTTLPTQSLHVVGDIFTTGNIGIGTTIPRKLLDIQGGDAIISGSIGIGTTLPRQLLDIQGGNIIIDGNIGIGTTNPLRTLDVNGTLRATLFEGNGSLPVGSVLAFAGTSAPTGFLICDGSSISRSVYAALFNVISTSHGSVDANTFNIPDYRGLFLRMIAGTSSVDPDKLTRTAMATGGNTGNAIGSIQGHAFQTHTHTQNEHNHSQSSHSHSTGFEQWRNDNPGYHGTGSLYGHIGRASDNRGNPGNAPVVSITALAATATNIATTATNNDAAASGVYSQASTLESRPVNAYVNYIIKF